MRNSLHFSIKFGIAAVAQFLLLLAPPVRPYIDGFSAQLATISAMFPAMFPTHVRYAGMAIAYNVSTSLFGGTAPRSQSENSTLSQAGADSADPGIRSTAGDPSTPVVDKGTTTRDIVAAPEGDGQSATTKVPS